MNIHDIEQGNAMNTNDIELPPPAQRIPYVGDVWTRDQVYAAIEADRKRHDRMLAHEWIRPALRLEEDAPYRFDFYAQEIEKLRNDSDYRKRRGEPETESEECLASLSPEDRMLEEIARMARESYMRHMSRGRGQMIVPADNMDTHIIWATKRWIEKNEPAPQPAEPEPCFCDRMYPDSNPDASCGDCPTRDYKKPAERISGLSAGQLAEILTTYITPEIIGEALEKLENAPWELSDPVKAWHDFVPRQHQNPDKFVMPTEPVRKTDWNNELSSWSDEDFIRIFHERPDLANRLRKMLAETVKVDAEASVPSDTDIDELSREWGLLSAAYPSKMMVRDFARALLARYG